MVFWLLLGLRRVAVLRRSVLTELDRRHPAPTAAAAVPVATDRAGFGTATGMRRYHAADCQMLAGKEGIRWAAEAAHVEAGLRPCPICTVGGLRPPTTPQERSVGEAPS
ncbi:hypothetical protein GCM10009547_22430 [Sporichthya brevicatena]|uniref:Ada DNA repair metal-binding domain-containing protein n=1 Tax=Sporichthya brevicatena TaxID=171442 RepID=A0ABP3RWH5_9ACTN